MKGPNPDDDILGFVGEGSHQNSDLLIIGRDITDPFAHTKKELSSGNDLHLEQGQPAEELGPPIDGPQPLAEISVKKSVDLLSAK